MRQEPTAAEAKEAPRPIIVRHGGPDRRRHHGGTWKIAYADFVTAMMAFFLLLWLANSTTEEQRTGIAEYFNPTNPLSRSLGGSGQPFGGRTIDSQAGFTSNITAAVRTSRQPPPTFDVDPEYMPQQRTGPTERAGDEAEWELNGHPLSESASLHQTGTVQLAAAAVQDAFAQRIASQAAGGTMLQGPVADLGPRRVEGAMASRQQAAWAQPDLSRDHRIAAERLMLRAAAQEIRSAIVMDPQLRSLAAHMLIEEVPEGLRIQMVDGEGQALFATGVAAPNERGRALLLRAASVIARLPHSLEITGHTDAAPFRSGSDARSNWELSVERANAARRLLLDAGITERRVRAMTGRADQELLRPTEPLHPANRRVSVLVMINQVPDNSAATNARLAP
jgi:chemotaxis protein MotB